MISPAVAAAVAAQKPVTHGLKTFELKPAGLKGLDLLQHMWGFNRRTGGLEVPSSYLDVQIDEVQEKLFTRSLTEITMGEIMKDAGGMGQSANLVKRKIDMYGGISGHSGIQNTPERMHSMKNKRDLALSVDTITRRKKKRQEQKQADSNAARLDGAEAAVTKLRGKGGVVSKLKVKEILSIMQRYYGVVMVTGANKAKVVQTLEAEIARDPTKLPTAAPAQLLSVAVGMDM